MGWSLYSSTPPASTGELCFDCADDFAGGPSERRRELDDCRECRLLLPELENTYVGSAQPRFQAKLLLR